MDKEKAGELVDAFIFEAIRDTDYDYYYDYQAKPSKQTNFHGVIDFLIYKKNHQFPLVAVVKSKKRWDKMVEKDVDDFNPCECIGVLFILIQIG